MANNSTMVPFMAVPPAFLLQEELEAREIAIDKFQEEVGIDNSFWNGLLDGTKKITEDLAYKISKVLGNIGPEIWIKLQNKYELDKKNIANLGKEVLA